MASNANATAKSGEPPEAIRRLVQVINAFFCPKTFQKGLQFKPKATDVIISSAPKSGSTWTQQICHQLRSGGDMSFEEIGVVVPCVELAKDFGCQPLESPQPYTPRMYKTHLPYSTCPKGAGKYVVVVRRPADAAVSLYHFTANWWFDSKEVSYEGFVDWIVLDGETPKGGVFDETQIHHILSWYEHRNKPNVLWMHYEDMQQDLRECVRLFADFLDVGRDDEKLQELVVEMSSLEFMKKNKSKFDAKTIGRSRNEAAGLPRDAGINNAKIRDGKSSKDSSPLPEHVLAKIQRLWDDVVTPATGYQSYDELRIAINKELGRKFT